MQTNEYRIQQVKHSGKELKWTPQIRSINPITRWKLCTDKNGNHIYFDDFHQVRHWLFWEDGAELYPDAGMNNSVYAFSTEGRIVKESATAETELLTTLCMNVKNSPYKAVYVSDNAHIEWLKHPYNRKLLIKRGIAVRSGRVAGELLLHDDKFSTQELKDFMQKTGMNPQPKALSQLKFKEPKYDLFICDCGDINHQFVVTVNEIGGEKDVFLEVRLNRYLSFWGRLRNAIRYLLKLAPPCRFGDYDCIILNKSHIEGLERVVNELKTL